jgi:trans-aconitate methyltransferase
VSRVTPEWLALREPADAAARATDLVDHLRGRLADRSHVVIHDLGCGTGSMGRWLAPRLPGSQHWVLHDRDTDLLDHAKAEMTGTAADGAIVTVETRQSDITRLSRDDLGDAALITASALLDMLTAEEVERLVAGCATVRCPTLLTISVVGRVELNPPDRLDAEITDAFNAHQRRTTGSRHLLGPDAVDAAVDAFQRRGATVLARPSPWRLGADQPGLIVEWFDGWLAAACEQRPELAGPATAYAAWRRADAVAGRLGVVVDHCDLLVSWE